MDLKDFQDINLQNIGEAPVVVRLLLFLVVIGIVVGAGYYFDIKDRYVSLAAVENDERALKGQFETKQAKAANLEAYKRQLDEMQETFGTLLRQLPDKTEVAGLLVDVSQTGLAAGLEFELFQPMGEAPKDFYAELPISIQVVGNYHEFGEFVSGLAALPRIVTIHDVQITIPERKAGEVLPGKMTMRAVVKTYRYLEEAG